jgi:DNA-binding transcriptional LysR family regulator
VCLRGLAQASRPGIGVAYVGESIVADDIASGRLVEVLNEWTPSYPGNCLYYPGRRHMAASLRAFINLARKIASREGVLMDAGQTVASDHLHCGQSLPWI